MTKTAITADVIVIGLGGMGSAACYQLARRGVRVVGLEQYTRAHELGSSHGETRIIRQAYFEHSDYVPLLKRAYTLWDELAVEMGQALFSRTGVAYYGPTGGTLLEGIRRSAQLHAIPIEEMDARTATRRFPGLGCPEGFSSIYEANAGHLGVEDCVRAQSLAAERYGAELHWQEPVLDWRSEGDGVVVHTARGKYSARRLVITAGAWNPQLLADLRLPLQVLRKVMFWVPAAPAADWGKMPGYLYDLPYGVIYGFGGTSASELKLAEHSGGDPLADPVRVNRELTPKDAENVLRAIRETIPGLQARTLRHKVCLYTMTPDQHFILGTHPQHPAVTLAAGFSGHGFKFASVMGEILADLAQAGKTQHPIGFLRLERFFVS